VILRDQALDPAALRGVTTPLLATDEADRAAKVAKGPPPPAVESGSPRPPDEGDVLALWRLMRRLGVPESDADDATQEVFSVVAQRHAEIRPGKERAFVFGTALRVARAWTRKHPPPVALDEQLATADDAPGLEDLLDQREARKLLDQLLEEMSFELRAVFVLYEIEELTMTEIARALELPMGTVASRLRRAREDFQTRVARLRARLAHRGTNR
jgi:RNA polymerase sigma-70 factor, ECF subfamily